MSRTSEANVLMWLQFLEAFPWLALESLVYFLPKKDSAEHTSFTNSKIREEAAT
jgi:hypothetical protein